MQSLSASLYTRCHEVFLRCSQFENYQNLSALFVTKELKPFKNGLKDANNPEALVDLFLEYIIDQSMPGDRPVFPKFIEIFTYEIFIVRKNEFLIFLPKSFTIWFIEF